MTSAPTDAALLRRAAWSVAVQTGVAVALVVVVVSLGSLLVFDRQQSVEVRDALRHAAATADDVTDPPNGIWLVRIAPASDEGAATRTWSPGTPAAVVEAAVLATAPSGSLSVDAGGERRTAWVDVRAGQRFVAVDDPSHHGAEEHWLIVSTSVAGGVGVLLAALIGLLVGRRAVRPLGAALALQRRFVADASHELRTPLAVVNTRAQLLRRRLRADASTSAELDQLVADTRVLGDVVADLLLSAQLQHRDLDGEEVDLTALGEAVVASMAPYAASRGVSLVTAPGGRSGSVGSAVVTGAPTALRRALSALVDNAVAHSHPGGRVTVQVGVADDEVRVAVIDHGDGLDPASAAQLTARFARGSQTGVGGRRFGLGLALVDEVVRAHHGRLEIDGAPGVGSTFTLVLPDAARPGQTSHGSRGS